METVTITLPTSWVAGVSVLALVALVSLLIGLALPRSQEGPTALERVQGNLGLSGLNSGAFFFAALMWLALALILFCGLLLLIWNVVWSTEPAQTSAPNGWEFRFKPVQLTALTAVLGAVVALPITLNRVRLQRETNETALDSLFNQKITEAAGDLHARRQVTQNWEDKDQAYDIWGDDVPKRVAAIDRLEGLVRERPEEAGRVSRLLSVYVRELSLENQAQVPEKGLSRDVLVWVHKLPQARSDMQSAVQVLGRLRGIEDLDREDLTFDLEGANLQRMRLNLADLYNVNLVHAQLQGANLGQAQLQAANLLGAQLQGANLGGAQLQGIRLIGARLLRANLGGALLQGANLIGAQLQGANLISAQLQAANLGHAQLQGAKLSGAQLDENTSLSDATLRGASLRDVDDTTIRQFAPFYDEVFAAWGETLPDGSPRPAHWIAERDDMTWDEFNDAWRAWQRSIGFDPENPE